MTEYEEPVARGAIATDGEGPRPVFVVWELTLRCDQACGHCGSRAAKARPVELSTAQCFDVAKKLQALGAREVSLIGGEAYLRTDLEDIVAEITRLGMRASMQTGGRGVTQVMCQRLKAAGMQSFGVSVDGPAKVHDRLRGNLGSHAAARKALRYARRAGMITSANTQINMLTHDKLWETARELQQEGIQSWQVQLTGPMGRAADRPEWILDPWRVVDVIDTLSAIQLDAVERGVTDDFGVPFNIVANNNVGYYGPHEVVIRSRPGAREVMYTGCQAGIFVLGIESDGTVKGCPTLPTAPYAGGNLLETPLEELWASSERLRFSRDRSTDELWGHCATCYYADECRAGCSWTVHTTLGRRGNNPFCYHRVKQLQRMGIRERLVPVEKAPNQPYDFGRFELVEEPWP